MLKYHNMTKHAHIYEQIILCSGLVRDIKRMKFIIIVEDISVQIFLDIFMMMTTKVLKVTLARILVKIGISSIARLREFPMQYFSQYSSAFV